MGQRHMFSQTIDEAIPLMEKLFRNFEQASGDDENRFVPILISRPGLGKSATIAKMAKRMGYELIDLNLACIEPTDIIGLGAREKIDGVWQTMAALPQWAEKALAGQCIILVDEFNNTTQDVLAGFQKMFSDFVIDGRKLPRTTHIIGACNPPGKDAVYAAKKLSGAFRRRLCMLPVVDDFDYVMKKHKFSMPERYMRNDYGDLTEYCFYEDISSAVVDNVFNIVGYEGISEYEKVALIAGFGDGAYNFARDMRLFSDDIVSSGVRLDQDDTVDYQSWKRDPGDYISQYQQILWGQDAIGNSVSYRRSKKFLSRVKNPSVYSALYGVLKEKFPAEYETDERKLPASREGTL